MRFVINRRPNTPAAEALPGSWHIIQQPSAHKGLWISILVGLGLQLIPLRLLILDSYMFPRVKPYSEDSVSWWILLPVIRSSIVVHEFLHLVVHPGGGGSEQSVVLAWPGRTYWRRHWGMPSGLLF